MAKIILNFNNTDYSIDESTLSEATASLLSHLSSVMSGSGAIINFNGTTYNIDSTKLSTATNNFISHLNSIAGSDSEVVVNGVKYSVDSTKLSNAMSELGIAFGNLSGGSTPDVPEEERLEGDGAEYYTLAPTALSFRSTAPLNELQEVQINGVTVDPSNYTLEEGSTIVTFPTDYLKTLNVGSYEVDIVSDSKTVRGGFTVAAPELNEHGFYYNQPYTAYVSYYNQNWTFFFRNDGTMDIIVLENGYIVEYAYALDGFNLTVTGELGTFTGSVSESGVYCNELGVTFVLGNGSIAADEDYIYIYKEDLGGYEVEAIDKTKAEYGAIKTGINGIDTMRLASNMFYNNDNMTTAPVIPNTVVGIASWAFYSCNAMTSVVIPDSVKYIDPDAFLSCGSLTNITFKGTMAQWNSIGKGENWNSSVPATYVQCSDGQVAL